jgi:pimeloyl-ACP methyl ester carboxylesterase
MAIVKIKGADVDVVQSGSGRDFLLLHSLLTDRSAFDLVVPELARNRRLTLVNLPGYGASFIAAHPGIVQERKRALERADPACFRTACLALARLDLGPVLRLIRNPTLVMAGALDQTTPPALARELAAGIAGATFREIPGCGHCPQIENPRASVDAVNGFLPS